MNKEDKRRWQEIFDSSLEAWREGIAGAVEFSRDNRSFWVSSAENPETFAGIMESAENDAFEEYEPYPDWDDNDKEFIQMYHDYLGKIKTVCEQWELSVMGSAESYDHCHRNDPEEERDEETATEYFKEYFNKFWGRA